MPKFKIDKETEYLIAILGPRTTGHYSLIMPAVIRAVDHVETPERRAGFVFMHDGVTSGSTGEVMEAVNKIQGTLSSFGRFVTLRKLPLDIEMHGKNSHYRWVDAAIELKPDLFVVLNDDSTLAMYAINHCQRSKIALDIVPLN
jgi:hypothetical protein